MIIPRIFLLCKREYNYCKKIWGVIVIFDYGPLWRTMERMNISQYQLLKGGIDNKTLDSLKKGKNITMVTLEKLCRIIGCTPNDIIEFK